MEVSGMQENRIRRDIVEAGRRLWERGFVVSNTGNISVRLSADEVLITPTRLPKNSLSEADLVKVDLSGNVISGIQQPTSELRLHLAVYWIRSDVQAIVRAHPRYASAFSLAGASGDRIVLPAAEFPVGSVWTPESSYLSLEELPAAAQRHIAGCDALMMANHGVLTVGADVREALARMEMLEHFAAISLHAETLRGQG